MRNKKDGKVRSAELLYCSDYRGETNYGVIPPPMERAPESLSVSASLSRSCPTAERRVWPR